MLDWLTSPDLTRGDAVSYLDAVPDLSSIVIRPAPEFTGAAAHKDADRTTSR